MEQKTLFDIPFWEMKIINFKEKKKEIVKLLKKYPEVQLQDLLSTKDMFAICKIIFVLVIGLMIFMENTNKVK